jgi:LPXTG-site transpeptidase (sortase) family protein
VSRRAGIIAVALGFLVSSCASGSSEPSTLLTGDQGPGVSPSAGAEPTLEPVASRPIGVDEIRLPGRAVGRSSRPGRPAQIGRLMIPKIGLSTAIFSGREAYMDQGPLHWYSSALPGQAGNSVFSGHRTTKTHPFRDLDDLSSGDRVTYDYNGRLITYLVYRVFVVKLDDYSILEHGDETITTLFACHPPGDNQHWLVAQARLTGTASPKPSPKPTPKPTPKPAAPKRTPGPAPTPRPLPTPSLAPPLP